MCLTVWIVVGSSAEQWSRKWLCLPVVPHKEQQGLPKIQVIYYHPRSAYVWHSYKNGNMSGYNIKVVALGKRENGKAVSEEV